MVTNFSNHQSSLTSPAADALAITPDDNIDLAQPTRALYVGASGHIRVQLISGTQVDFNNAQAGMIYPLRVARVLDTGTTAGGLVGLS